MWKRIKHSIAEWIPTHVSPRLVAWFYSVSDRLSVIRKSVREEHRQNNEYVLNDKDSPLKEGYIENQEEWKTVKFGKATMAFSGCEIMAVYNVLYALGKGSGTELVCDLIEEFEKSGAALLGMIGSSPSSIRRQLKKRGIRSRVVWKEENIDEDADIAVVTVYNNKKTLYSQIHTITFVREQEGFRPHNARSKCRYYKTLREAVNGVGSDPKMICAILIEK